MLALAEAIRLSNPVRAIATPRCRGRSSLICSCLRMTKAIVGEEFTRLNSLFLSGE
jgi:hypothetical protein